MLQFKIKNIEMAKLLKYNQIVEELIEKDSKISIKPLNDKDLIKNNDIKNMFVIPNKDNSDKIEQPKIKFSDKLKEILEVIEDEDNFVAYEILWLSEPRSIYHNGIKIENVDISTEPSSFDVTILDKKVPMKIEKFIKYYFSNNYLKQSDINDFINSYNLLAGSEEEEETNIRSLSVDDKKYDKLKSKIDRTKVEIPTFSYSPDDVRRTFISLVTKTYPHGTEDKLLPFLPKLNKDPFGNYYKIIGDKPTTMFTCHLDTAGRKESNVVLFTRRDQNNEEIIYTDGNTILGADDKSGTAIMLYMIDKKVPGLYYFFIGEEVGGIGSGKVARDYNNIEYLKELKRCVSFDRRGIRSVITKQLGRPCCSESFAISLSKEYNNQGFNLAPDPTGIYTDSASFVDYIPECTNISVGYQSEHSGSETQNMDYLIRLAKASVEVNWDSLPTNRKIGLDDVILKKYSKLIYDIKDYPFPIDVRIITDEDDTVFIRCDLEDGFITETYESLNVLKYLLQKNNVKQTVYFEDEYIKIKLAK